MEDPGTWGKAEHVVRDAIYRAEDGHREGRVGLSVVRQITDALRKANLLKEEDAE